MTVERNENGLLRPGVYDRETVLSILRFLDGFRNEAEKLSEESDVDELKDRLAFTGEITEWLMAGISKHYLSKTTTGNS